MEYKVGDFIIRENIYNSKLEIFDKILEVKEDSLHKTRYKTEIIKDFRFFNIKRLATPEEIAEIIKNKLLYG